MAIHSNTKSVSATIRVSKSPKMQLLLLLVLAFLSKSTCNAFDNLYYSYVDATCIDDFTIDGESLMQFEYIETEYVSSLQLKEIGNCYYLKEGYVSHDTLFGLDRDDDDDNAMHDWDGYGYCVTCDGVTGCSSDGTCENFKSKPAPYYENSHTVYGNSVNSDSGTTTNSDDTITLEMLATVPSKKFQKILQQSNGTESSAPLMPLMVVAGILVAALIVSLALVIRKQRRKKIGHRDLSAAMLANTHAPRTATIEPQVPTSTENTQRSHVLV